MRSMAVYDTVRVAGEGATAAVVCCRLVAFLWRRYGLLSLSAFSSLSELYGVWDCVGVLLPRCRLLTLFLRGLLLCLLAGANGLLSLFVAALIVSSTSEFESLLVEGDVGWWFGVSAGWERVVRGEVVEEGGTGE